MLIVCVGVYAHAHGLGAHPAELYWRSRIHMDSVLRLYNTVRAFSSRRFSFSWIFPFELTVSGSPSSTAPKIYFQ